MADQEKDKQMQIDDMLDSLLANYSSAEPRPGLESRILANLQGAAENEFSAGWWNFKWFWAGVVAVAIIVGAVLIGGRHRVAPPTHVVVRNSQPAPQPEIQPHAPASGKETAKIHRRKRSAPNLPQNATLALNQRPAIFPTPTPLSEQEQLLLRYLARTPRGEVIAQSRPDEALAGNLNPGETIPDLTHIPQKLSNTR
jgi:hypothetical protein